MVDQFQAEADVYQALAHPVRLAILEVLRRDEECVCHLTALFRKPQAYVSQQLAVLREAGLLVDRKDGVRVYYQLRDPRIGELLDGVRAILGTRQLNLLGLVAGNGRVPVNGCECPKCTA